MGVLVHESEAFGDDQKHRGQEDTAMKTKLHRIVAMLTRLAIKFDGVADLSTEYDAKIGHNKDHGCAEQESQTEAKLGTMGCNGAAVVRFIVRSLPTTAACGSRRLAVR